MISLHGNGRSVIIIYKGRTIPIAVEYTSDIKLNDAIIENIMEKIESGSNSTTLFITLNANEIRFRLYTDRVIKDTTYTGL